MDKSLLFRLIRHRRVDGRMEQSLTSNHALHLVFASGGAANALVT